jgi:thiol-disulfide isomerase/thioredoxin
VLPALKKSGLLPVAVLCLTLAQGAALNRPAPPFVLNNFHRQSRALSEYRGKVVFINFWASWCAPCQIELPELNRLATEHRGRLKVLAINVDHDRSAARQLLVKLGLAHANFEALWDARSKVVRAYNIDAMPSSFIVDPRGVIRFNHSGFHPRDPGVWRQEINTLLRQ